MKYSIKKFLIVMSILIISILNFNCGTELQFVRYGNIIDPDIVGAEESAGYLPKSQALLDIPPIVFDLKVKDSRKIADRVADEKNGLGMKTGKVTTKLPEIFIIWEAIKNELMRHNHILYEPKNNENKPIIIIECVLKEFWAERNIHFTSVETSATIRVGIVVRNAKTSEILMTKIFVGSHGEKSGLLEGGQSTRGEMQRCFNIALRKFLLSMRSDSDFLDALRKAAN